MQLWIVLITLAVSILQPFTRHRSYCAFISVATVYTAIWVQDWLSKRKTAQYLRQNHLQAWPIVQGKLPGNIDLFAKIAREADARLPGQAFADMTRKYGLTFDLRPMGSTLLYTQDPEVIRHIMSAKPQNYVKGAHLNSVFQDVLGSGIFNSDGHRWRSHRLTARPFFHKDNLTDFTIFRKHCDVLVQSIEMLSGEQTDKRPVEFHNLAARFTLDAATEFLFGASVQTLKSVMEDQADPPYLTAFERVQERLGQRLKAGSIWPLVQPRFAMKADMQIVRGVVDEAIAKVHTTQDKASSGLLSMLELLEAQEPALSPMEKREELLNVLMAARDTTASLLTSIIYELARHPEIQTQARNEVYNLVGDEGAIVFEDLKSLKLLRAVIDETLRLYPPISANSRVSVEDDVITAGGCRFFVKAGTHVGWGTFQMQRDEDLWGNEAGQWKPSRWLARNGIPATNTAAFQAWGSGPRICIGQELAYIEATYVVTRLLQSFRSISVAPDAQPERSWYTRDNDRMIMPEAPVVTLKLRGGVWLRFHR